MPGIPWCVKPARHNLSCVSYLVALLIWLSWPFLASLPAATSGSSLTDHDWPATSQVKGLSSGQAISSRQLFESTTMQCVKGSTSSCKSWPWSTAISFTNLKVIPRTWHPAWTLHKSSHALGSTWHQLPVVATFCIQVGSHKWHLRVCWQVRVVLQLEKYHRCRLQPNRQTRIHWYHTRFCTWSTENDQLVVR